MTERMNLTEATRVAEEKRRLELEVRRRRIEERQRAAANAANAAGLAILVPEAEPASQTLGEFPTVGNSPTVGKPTPDKIPTVGNSDSSTAGIPTVGEFPTVGNSPRDRSAPTTGNTPTVGNFPAVENRSTIGDSPRVHIQVPYKDGELRIPNWIVYHLYPLLELDERAVYQELYLWTWGFGISERRLSQRKLCQSLRTTDKTLTRILGELAKKGLIEIGEALHTGPRSERGTLFQVHRPDVIPTPGKSPTIGIPPTVGEVPNIEKRKEKKDRKGARRCRSGAFYIRTKRASGKNPGDAPHKRSGHDPQRA